MASTHRALSNGLINYVAIGEELGACAAICVCTTVTGAVYEAARSVKIPFMTIDRPMLEKAVRMGKRVALLVTSDTTIQSSDASINLIAQQAGIVDVAIDTIFIPGASNALNIEGDKPKHDRIVADAAKEAALNHDVVVLGQLSMVEAGKLAGDCGIPILTSVDSGLDQLTQYLS